MDAAAYYSATARHYDPAYATAAPEGDVAFYVDLARRAGGPVLEIGCGTGRILIPALEAGVDMEGLDFSPALLAVLRAKLAPGRDAALHEADMRGFSLPRKYRAILIPFRPLQHLTSLDDQIAALGCVRRHLEPEGLLAFNVFYPDFRRMEEQAGEEPEMSWNDPDDPSVTVTRFFRRLAWNRLEQHFDIEFIHRFHRAGAILGEERSALRMSYYTWPHLRLLLRHCGFAVIEEYGSFAREPVSICREMIVIARATG